MFVLYIESTGLFLRERVGVDVLEAWTVHLFRAVGKEVGDFVPVFGLESLHFSADMRWVGEA